MEIKKSLITITTCNRLAEVKKFIIDYIDFCNSHDDFDFLLALDGTEPGYLDFCNSFQIPLIYSNNREGVGLSKNRVLEKFPNYAYYFFIEDDIEIVDSSIFDMIIIASNYTGHQHFCNNHVKNQTNSESLADIGLTLTHSMSGGSQICFFTNKGIKTIGGWNTLFAKYKRFGHTEHSYRVIHSKMQPSPFIFIQELFDKFIVHSPPVVTKLNIDTNEFELISEEQQLIDKRITYFPVQTISGYHFNGFNMHYNHVIAEFIKGNKRKYPLIKGRERWRCLSSYYFFLSTTKKNLLLKFFYFCWAIFLYPMNPEIKHAIKTSLK